MSPHRFLLSENGLSYSWSIRALYIKQSVLVLIAHMRRSGKKIKLDCLTWFYMYINVYWGLTANCLTFYSGFIQTNILYSISASMLTSLTLTVCHWTLRCDMLTGRLCGNITRRYPECHMYCLKMAYPDGKTQLKNNLSVVDSKCFTV